MTEPEEGVLSATGSPGTEARRRAPGRKLLLVDDDAPLRRSMARALERRDFQVLAAEGGPRRGRSPASTGRSSRCSTCA